jgi:hypothetical protein
MRKKRGTRTRTFPVEKTRPVAFGSRRRMITAENRCKEGDGDVKATR